MSDLRLLAILENIDKLDAAKSNEFLRDLCKQAAKEIAELNALRLRREWQGLTAEEFDWILNGNRGARAFIKVTEARLKEKNT